MTFLKMLLWLLFLAYAFSSPADEFRSFVNEGELTVDDAKYLKKIVPSGFSPLNFLNSPAKLSDILDEDDEHVRKFNYYVEKGVTIKGSTFSVYNDDMMEASVALFRLLQHLNNKQFEVITEWAKYNMNYDIFEYAWRLLSFYTDKNQYFHPRFHTKPNYFVNSETVFKAFRLKLNNGNYNENDGTINQFHRKKDSSIYINTNYSGWNLGRNVCEQETNYFREDIGLNSYYYGVHLSHPFWMTNEELEEIDPRHAEYYYFIHQQLMARYLLEKEHVQFMKSASDKTCDNYYDPNLVYDNGLRFPIRSFAKGKWNNESATLKSIEIALKECISRGLIIMDNGTAIQITEDNYIDLISKLIRANYNGDIIAQIVRSVYGGDEYSTRKYNPAPSVLHHPETSLRDPVYWNWIQFLLNYFTEYKNIMEPYDLSKDLTYNISITSVNLTEIVTYFEPYHIDMENAMNDDYYFHIKSSKRISARQRRLAHFPLTMNFTVESESDEDVIVRLFLGPLCSDCWLEYSRFYELDSFNYKLIEGSNILSWSPEKSYRYNDDYYCDIETSDESFTFCKNSLYKFPKRLMIPKGLEDGLNLTLFIIITIPQYEPKIDLKSNFLFYKFIYYKSDKKPLGFPFHRKVFISDNNAKNFMFYNVTIYHKKNHAQLKSQFDYFTPNLL